MVADDLINLWRKRLFHPAHRFTYNELLRLEHDAERRLLAVKQTIADKMATAYDDDETIDLILAEYGLRELILNIARQRHDGEFLNRPYAKPKEA